MNTNKTICVETECTEEGHPYQVGTVHLILCQQHRYELGTDQKKRARKVISELDSVGGIARHIKGWTYVVRMANGNVKIGTTEKPDLERFQRLSRDYNGGFPVHVLAVVKGGESLEYLFHERWFSLRSPGRMEEFHPDFSLLHWAEGLGIDDGVDMERYWDWQVKRQNRKDAPVPEMFGDVVEQMKQLQRKEAEEFWS